MTLREQIRFERIRLMEERIETLEEALGAVRNNLIRLAWEENSLIIEGIDKALGRRKNAPEEVMTLAIETTGVPEDDTGWHRSSDVFNIVATAIRAERDRCAKLVNNYAANLEIAEPSIAEEIRVEVLGHIATRSLD